VAEGSTSRRTGAVDDSSGSIVGGDDVGIASDFTDETQKSRVAEGSTSRGPGIVSEDDNNTDGTKATEDSNDHRDGTVAGEDEKDVVGRARDFTDDTQKSRVADGSTSRGMGVFDEARGTDHRFGTRAGVGVVDVVVEMACAVDRQGSVVVGVWEEEEEEGEGSTGGCVDLVVVLETSEGVGVTMAGTDVEVVGGGWTNTSVLVPVAISRAAAAQGLASCDWSTPTGEAVKGSLREMEEDGLTWRSLMARAAERQVSVSDWMSRSAVVCSASEGVSTLLVEPHVAHTAADSAVVIGS